MQPSRYLFKFLSFIPVLPGFTMIVQRIYQLVEVLELIASFFFLIKRKESSFVQVIKVQRKKNYMETYLKKAKS